MNISSTSISAGDLDLGGVPPGAVRVGPGLDPVRPGALGVGRDLGLIAAREVERRHVDQRAVLALGVGQDDAGAEQVVALAEHAGLDRQRLAGDRFDRVAALLEDRADVGDGDAGNH